MKLQPDLAVTLVTLAYYAVDSIETSNVHHQSIENKYLQRLILDRTGSLIPVLGIVVLDERT